MFHDLLNGSRLAATPDPRSRFLLESGKTPESCNTDSGVADLDAKAARFVIQVAAWDAVDSGRADAYTGIDFQQLDDNDLLLVAARCFAELERNVREDAR